MSSALMRGRTLDPDAVAMARKQRAARIHELEIKPELTPKERKELQRIKS